MTNQLGKAISILIAAQDYEINLHQSVSDFYAPNECHSIVSKGQKERMRMAKRRALHFASARSMRILKHKVRKVINNDAPIYRKFGVVPY